VVVVGRMINAPKTENNKLRGLSPLTNYTDRATAACEAKLVPHFADGGCHVVSVTDPYSRNLGFLDRDKCSIKP
jgi:hypothetical protein